MATRSSWMNKSKKSWTEDGTPICYRCGKFCQPADQQTPFGTSDPENPEPYDPEFFCDKCAKWLEGYWDRHFEGGFHYDGYWQKSQAEIKAAKKHGLVWVESLGIEALHTSEDVHQRYLSITDCRLKKHRPDLYLEATK